MSPRSVANPPEPSRIAALSAERQEKLAEILEGCLIEMENGLAPDPEQLAADYPDLAEPLRAHLESLRLLQQAAGSLGAVHLARPARNDLVRRTLGDYEILREIGRGGMGVVYEARQVSLDRQVALKLLPFAAVLDQKQIARFRNEAQAAAQLHHSNIVPVFAVGYERGVHYYTMQYIDGQPLDAAIRQLRRLERRETPPPGGQAAPDAVPDTSATGTPEGPPSHAASSTLKGFSTAETVRNRDYIRGVAELGIQVADALQYAHELGIVHRDIKPSNLLLGAEGRIWVTDFGLARFQTDASLTLSGDVMGTVRYMSPEQAAGRATLVDHRTDIYSLGITLYELLTLRYAFDGNNRQEFLRQIEHQEPEPPRRLNPAVPVDLETIVLKAIAKSPQQRYATAAEMAADLRHFLGGEPVEARRPTLADRAAKWARRHKAVVASAAGLLAVVLAALALVAVREHVHTRDALAQTKANYRQARDLVDRLGANYAEQLSALEGAEGLRHELLSDTRAYYEQFVRHAAADPSLRADLAVTCFKMGTVNEQLGEDEKALAAYRRAEGILSEMVAERPDDARLRSQLALCANGIGLLLARTGKTADAEAAYTRAIDLQQKLVEDRPEEPAYRGELALSYCNLGLLQHDTARPDDAQRSYGEAIARQEALVEESPDDAGRLRNLAVSYNNLSYLLAGTEPGRAEEFCRKAIAIQQRLVDAQPETARRQSDLALSWNNLGSLQSRAGRLKDASESFGRAIAAQEALRRKAPLVVAYRRDLAVSYNNLGQTSSRLGLPEKAGDAFRCARDIVEELVAQYPDDLAFRSSLGGILNNQGMIFEQLSRPEDAMAAYRKAIEHQRFAVARAPEVTRFREFLGVEYINYGRVLRATRRNDEANEIELAYRELSGGRITPAQNQRDGAKDPSTPEGK